MREIEQAIAHCKLYLNDLNGRYAKDGSGKEGGYSFLTYLKGLKELSSALRELEQVKDLMEISNGNIPAKGTSDSSS